MRVSKFAPSSRPTGRSLRSLLAALLVGVAVYVAAFSVYFAVRTGTVASDLSVRSGSIPYLYGEVSQRVIELNAAVAATNRSPPADTMTRRLAAAALRSDLLAQSHRAAPAYLAQIPPSMRVPLARVDEQITELQNAILEWSALVERNRLSEADRRRPLIDSVAQNLAENLSYAQQQGLSDMLTRANELEGMGRFGLRAVIVWLLLGTVSFGPIVWLVWRQVDRPLRDLEAGLARVATGDLGVRLPVARVDELGRLTEHFNRMTEVLDHRAQQHGRFVAAGELIAGIAHEVNNPLMAVTAVVSNRLADDHELSHELHEELHQVLRQSRRAGKLVTGLLRFVRGGNEKVGDYDLDAVTRDAVDLVSHRFPVEEIELQYEPVGRGTRVSGDGEKIEQVLVNLLSNAADALRDVPPPRIIALKARSDHATATLTLEDNGPGIPPDVAPRLFHPFVSSKGDKGTGLGLYISREIARSVGGDITLEQGGLGGACFVLRLPLSVAGRTVPLSQEESLGDPIPHTGETSVLSGASILVVDDEAAVRSPVARFLRRCGAEVTEAGDGIEGLMQVARRHFDVILADVRMPRMDGPGFYRGLLERYPDSAPKVLFLSGDISQLSDLELGGISGGRVILKPVELAILEARIGEVVLLNR